MQLELVFTPPKASQGDRLVVGSTSVPLRLVRSARARRYILRLDRDGTARVTVPRRGSLAGARAFATSQIAWLARQLQRRASEPRPDTRWLTGRDILFRGHAVPLTVASDGMIRFADQQIEANQPLEDLRPLVEERLRTIGARELPARVWELASQHQVPVKRVSIRGQRSRWGSCSTRGTISLNWRLIQTPDWVQDYIVLHELMHLRVMNHSRRFWREVEKVCPNFTDAERWLKTHSRLLH